MSQKLPIGHCIRFGAFILLGFVCLTQYSPQAANISTDTATSHAAGMRVVRDPDTNENLKASAAESASTNTPSRFRAQVSASQPEQVFEERPSDHPDGGMVIELNGAFNSHMKVSISPITGELESHCNHDPGTPHKHSLPNQNHPLLHREHPIT